MTTRKYQEDPDEDEARGLIEAVKNLILSPIYLLISRPLRRAYLTIALLGLVATTLFGLATIAYVLFYNAYIPRIGFERPIHLQFDNVYTSFQNGAHEAHPFPYGSVSLGTDLVSNQKYDITIELTLPRTPSNEAAGNFMLEVTMYAPTTNSLPPTSTNILDILRKDSLPFPSPSTPPNPLTTSTNPTLLARSRRTAILPYRTPLLITLHQLLTLPLTLPTTLFRAPQSESHTLVIPAFESLTFPRGRRSVPTTLHLEVQSTAPLQLYSAKLVVRARFEGLRWVMYRHWFVSGVLLTGAFWATEVVFAVLAWVVVAGWIGGGGKWTVEGRVRGKKGGAGEEREKVKVEEDAEEDEDVKLSDTERSFPTLRGQMPLRYTSASSDPEVKKEEVEDEGREEVLAAGLVPEAVSRAMEADDEDEDGDLDFLDSGIGTSMESSAVQRRESMRRRRGRVGGGDNGDKHF